MEDMKIYIYKKQNYMNILKWTKEATKDANLTKGSRHTTKSDQKAQTEEENNLKLDVVHWRGGHHAVEGGEAVFVADLLTVQLKLRLAHFPVHVQSHERLKKRINTEPFRAEVRFIQKQCTFLTLYIPAHMFW